MNQYPTEEELEKIRTWEVLSLDEYHALMSFVRERWAYASSGYFDREGIGFEHIYRLHTAGWSGNEDIIAALQQNIIFWSLYWYQSQRGGHYIFMPSNQNLAYRMAKEKP